MTYKVGDIITGRNDGICAFLKGEILAAHPRKGNVWLIEVTEALPEDNRAFRDGYDVGSIAVRSSDVLNNFYKKAPAFFEIGKTYTDQRSWSDDGSVRIIDLYKIDNPAWDHSSDYALGVMTMDEGEIMVLLDKSEFKNWKRA
jgi:hypothetical protein